MRQYIAIEPKAISQLSLPILGIFIYSFQLQFRHFNSLPKSVPNKDLVINVLTNLVSSVNLGKRAVSIQITQDVLELVDLVFVRPDLWRYLEIRSDCTGDQEIDSVEGFSWIYSG